MTLRRTVGLSLCGLGLLRCGTAIDPDGASNAPTVIGAPQAVSPLALASVFTSSPLLRWRLAPGTDGAHVTICADRGCAQILESFDVIGTSATPPTPLSVGVVYWNLRGRSGAATGTLTSVTRSFRVRASAQARSRPVRSGVDVNGDGFADVIVGVPTAGPGGRVYGFDGGPSGLATSASQRLDGQPQEGLGTAVANGGDVNADGNSDVVVGAQGASYVLYGGSDGLALVRATAIPRDPTAPTGAVVAGGGDFDGDGYDDVVLTSQEAAVPGQPLGGKAFLYLGGAAGVATSASRTFENAHGGNFGATASLGDVDGDGRAEVWIGSAYAGTVDVFGLSSHVTLVDPSGLVSFGMTYAVGDFNGDGFDDTFARSRDEACDLFAGAADGLDAGNMLHVVSGFVFPVPSSVGDVNGDGSEDLFVSGTFVPGRPDGLPAVVTPTTMDGVLLIAATGVGDVNADGFDDVALVTTAGNAYENVSVALGGPNGPDVAHAIALTIDGPDLMPEFGVSVAGIR